MTRDRLHFAMPRPVPPGLWRRTPPAMFPPILGTLALALAWLGGAGAFGLPLGLAQMGAGMAVAVGLFAVTAYAVKLIRRPAVLAEELTVLPGRTGVAAGVPAVVPAASVAEASVSSAWVSDSPISRVRTSTALCGGIIPV